MTKEDRCTLAIEKFLNLNPHIEGLLMNLREEANALGTDIREYRNRKAKEYFAACAEELGLDTYEYILELTCDTCEEKRKLILDDHREVASCLGQSWADYFVNNPHLNES